MCRVARSRTFRKLGLIEDEAVRQSPLLLIRRPRLPLMLLLPLLLLLILLLLQGFSSSFGRNSWL